MPARTIPTLACLATAGELSLAVLLVLGVRVRWVALGAAVLLALFGSAMAISFGPKEPLDYSVFSASACALLLANTSKNPHGERAAGRTVVCPTTGQ